MRRLNLLGVVAGIMVVGIMASVAQAQVCTPAPAGIVAWWSGDVDGRDIVGANNGTLENDALAGVPGLVGGAFGLDGTGDHLATALVLPNVGTIEGWVKAAPSLLNTIHGIWGTFGSSDGDNRMWFNSRGPTGGLGIGPNQFVVNAGSCCVNELVADSGLILGAWNHLAVVFDYAADVFALFVNGVQVRMYDDQPRTPSTGVFLIGVNDGNFNQTFFFPGLIDEVSVYNRALAAYEIAGIFAAADSGKCKDGTSLEERITALENHTHEYLTGSGGGHNTVPVSTSQPE